jgi:periplasmic protein TonB
MKTRSILIASYEIKRPYQKNMALAFVVSSLILLALAALSTILYHSQPVIAIGGCPFPYYEELKITPPQVYVPDKPRATTTTSKPLIGIPVPGTEIETENERTIPTAIELARLAPETPITELGSGVVINTKNVFESGFPAIDSFIPVDEQPVQITMPEPKYPELARKAGIERKLFVKALIDKDGIVKKALVDKPDSSDIGFEAAAIEAAMQSTWRPAICNGQPLAVWVTYLVVFKLK